MHISNRSVDSRNILLFNSCVAVSILFVICPCFSRSIQAHGYYLSTYVQTTLVITGQCLVWQKIQEPLTLGANLPVVTVNHLSSVHNLLPWLTQAQTTLVWSQWFLNLPNQVWAAKLGEDSRTTDLCANLLRVLGVNSDCVSTRHCLYAAKCISTIDK